MMLDHYGKRNMQAVVAQRALLLHAGAVNAPADRFGHLRQNCMTLRVALIGELRPLLVAGV